MNIEYIDNEIKMAKIRIRELENLKETKLKDVRDRNKLDQSKVIHTKNNYKYIYGS